MFSCIVLGHYPVTDSNGSYAVRIMILIVAKRSFYNLMVLKGLTGDFGGDT